MRRRTAAVVIGSVAACLVLSGCGIGMPDSGKVNETSTTGSSHDEQPANIDPPRPKPGGTPADIVNGFLFAMTATPAIRTSVAREFLTQEAGTSWQPTGLVVYSRVLTPHGNNDVETTLIDADRIDERGAWLGPLSEDESTITFTMALEDGEWRIAQPPPYVLVPQSWFEQRFQQVSLYFFDPSDTVLVPEPIFVPRGRQFASTLVNGLLDGPAPGLTEQTFLPPGLRSVVSVAVSAGGLARVELTSDAADADMPSPDRSELMVSQLAWTLRQDPTITRFEVFIDDQAVQLASGTEFGVDHGHEYAPFVAGSSTLLFGLQDGMMVGGSPQNLQAVAGPFGQDDYDLRTVSPDLRAEQVAAVSTSGSTLWLASVKDSGTDPRQLITTGEDLLRPAWDFSGRLWVVDRRTTGAVVSYLRNDRMHEIDVEGVTGRDVKDLLVSRDGSRLIAVIRDDAENDSIVVSRILTTGDGQVAQALAADDISDPANPGHIRDIAWRSPTSLVVLRPVLRDLYSVRTASVDGATGLDSFSAPIDADVVGLVGTPVPDEKIYAFAAAAATSDTRAHAELRDLAGSRADQIVLDPRMTMLSYVS